MMLIFDRVGMSEADARLQLAEEDQLVAEDGDIPLHRVTSSRLMIELLDIEEQQ